MTKQIEKTIEKHKAYVPALRFPEFKDCGEWEEKTLGAVGTFLKGKGVSKADIHHLGQTLCIRYGELYTKYKETINEVFSKTNIDDTQLQFSRNNDVLIPSSGETKLDIATASCLLLDNIALGGDINIVRGMSYSGVFLSYYLNGNLKYGLAKVAQGDAVVHLYIEQIKKLIAFFPSLPEQQKIADCLSSVDVSIDAHTKKFDLLKEYKKGLLQKLFQKNGQKIPEYRFPEFKDCGEWEEKTLGDVCNYTSSSLSTKDIVANGKYELYDANTVVGRVDNYASKDTYITIIKDGAGVGRTRLLNGETNFIGTMGMIQNNKSSDIAYLYNLLITLDLKIYVVGGAIPHIYFKDYSQLQLALPPIPEQEKIADCLSTIDKKIDAQSEKIQSLKEHKKGLMQQLFPC